MSDDIQLEQWRRPRNGLAVGYHVSSLGRVLGPRGIMRGEVDCNGYVRMCIAGKKHMVHRLVGKAFVAGYRPGLVINHIDCDKQNNTPGNLQWVTQKENIAHSWAMGRQKPKRGEDKWNAVLTADIVERIPVEICRGEYGSVANFARKYGVTVGAVQGALCGGTWKHIIQKSA